MNEQNNSDIFEEGEAIDLGGTPTDFDPFAQTEDDETITAQTPEPPAPQPEAPAANPLEQAMEAAETKETSSLFSRAPQFVYAGASEDIADTGITFEELRQAKETDFPELSDGKRVSWSVEYGKITKQVSDPKGTTVGKMKTQIEQSKEFLDSLKKIKTTERDTVTCKIKPRVTAQSKGERALFPPYKALFTSMGEAVTSGKTISIIPARNGNVYEMRQNDIGTFITPSGCVPELPEVSAGFIPALPRIPIRYLREIIGFFRFMMKKDKEALVHILWDKTNNEYRITVPKQSVTKVSVNAELERDYDAESFIHVMDIHSHNSMAARFSQVDDEDEKATRLYTVIGRLDRFLPQINVRISNGGKYLPIHPGIVFEGMDTEYPDLWSDSVTLPGGDGE